MPRPPKWSELTIGLLAAAGIAVAVVGVLLFARVGGLHGRTTRLYLVTKDANQVIKGTEVWVAGQEVGAVHDVRFRPASVDTLERVLIEMDVLSKYVGQIRRNSDVQLRPGMSLIGAPVVAISAGTVNAPTVREGDTLHVRRLVEDRRRTSDLASLGDSVVAVSATMRSLSADVRATGRELVQLRRRSEVEMRAVGKAADRFSARATASHGSVSMTLHDTAFHAALARLTAQTDSLRRLVAARRRLVSDSTVLWTAQHLRASADTLRARVVAWRRNGLLPQTHADSALPHQIDQVHRQLDSLITDVKRHPFKYLSL